MSAHQWGVRMAHHRKAVLIAWLAILVACMAGFPVLQSHLGGPNYGVNGSQSAQVGTLLQRHFAGEGAEQDVIVFNSPGDITDTAGRAAVDKVLAAAHGQTGVAGVLSPFDPKAHDQVSADHHAALALIGLDGSPSQLTSRSGKVQNAVQDAVKNDAGGVQAYLTGYSPITNDLTAVENADSEHAESIGMPIALAVLLFALGAVVAALLPLLLAMAGLVLAFGIVTLLTLAFNFDAFLVTIITMIGTGIGIDYALFIVSRFREELARRGVTGKGGGPQHRAQADQIAEAAGSAMATSGRTVLFSGVVVAISMCSLFIVNSSVFQEISVAVLIVVVSTLAAAWTLLPAVLVMLGARVNRGSLPRRFQPADIQPGALENSGGWARWAHTIMRHPVTAGVAAVAVLVLAALPVGDMHYGIDLGTASLTGKPSAKAQQVLEHSFGPGVVSPVQMIVTGPGDTPLSPSGLQQAQQLATTVGQDKRVSAVDTQQVGGRVLIDAVPSVPIDSSAATDLVRHLRDEVIPQTTAHTGTVALVGGATAVFLDLTHETNAKVPYILLLVLGLSLLFLLVVFRSVVLPVKAVAMNLLATAAAMGLTVAVFQWGHGSGLLGFTSVGFLQVYLPISVFVMLFGLSMDYEVFLIRRMQEVWQQTRDNATAVATGIEHTARPIAAAAAIMVAVFGSFMIANVLELKQFGLALSAAIALDATLIRLVLVPALMRLLGGWNWWLPSGLARLLPGGAAANPVRPPEPARESVGPDHR
ncbi:MMPL family transporter [Actinocrinis puniceicyclus]|uniref:MMPL family transporter n=1 Tax=Actinocrinis puniceicyclus TaxID=977794 RepID=A0A8J7WQM4_9ACTN|nr:MMPL family transporter [Actinocrinis puniceicyclus]MBS2964632.1 MMPL family transporter [Actinocrinis puniceicyclus]